VLAARRYFRFPPSVLKPKQNHEYQIWGADGERLYVVMCSMSSPKFSFDMFRVIERKVLVGGYGHEMIRTKGKLGEKRQRFEQGELDVHTRAISPSRFKY
jgi:hypothetical protein